MLNFSELWKISLIASEVWPQQGTTLFMDNNWFFIVFGYTRMRQNGEIWMKLQPHYKVTNSKIHKSNNKRRSLDTGHPLAPWTISVTLLTFLLSLFVTNFIQVVLYILPSHSKRVLFNDLPYLIQMLQPYPIPVARNRVNPGQNTPQESGLSLPCLIYKHSWLQWCLSFWTCIGGGILLWSYAFFKKITALC